MSIMSIMSIVRSNVDKYIVCSDLSLSYNYGFIILVLIILQIVTGLWITTLYYSTSGYESLIKLTKDIYYGLLIRNIHGSLPTLIQFCILYHISRGIIYGSIGSYSSVWISGIILYLLVCMICYMGYVLPYGQISYWGIAVIVSILPNIIREWMFGDNIITIKCVNRYLVFHYLIPFILLLVIIIHMYYLHYLDSSVSSISFKSNSIITSICKIEFYPLMVVKDLWFLSLFIFIIVLLTTDQIWNHGDNNDKANSLKTPNHIVPEWYFLYLYSILKCIPEFYSGIISMLLVVSTLINLLLINNLLQSRYNIRRYTLLLLVILFVYYLSLVYIGSDLPTIECTTLGRYLILSIGIVLTLYSYLLL